MRLLALWLFLALFAGTSTSTRPVDLNHATLAELVTLPGIGPVRARAIIARRPYRRLRELRKIRGIGPKLLRRIAPRVLIRPDRSARPGS